MAFISIITATCVYNFIKRDSFSSPENTLTDLIAQLNFLKEEIRTNQAAHHMQELYPEGFVFLNVLYGLSWTEVAMHTSHSDSLLFKEALKEARFAYNEITSHDALRMFQEDLPVSYGAFYSGWKNYLSGKILLASGTKDSALKMDYIFQCELMARKIEKSDYPFFESYSHRSWPADILPAIASLKIHDRLFPPRYQNLCRKWVESVKSNLDPLSGMIPHQVDVIRRIPLEKPRGSSMALILIFLSEIDPAFGHEQFQRFREAFLFSRFGFPACREYPIGTVGSGDIDSGPVVFNVGFSATIVSVGSLLKYGEIETADRLSDAIEMAGFSYSHSGKKVFLFGNLPIADAFISWTRSMSL